jgi:hypothetical protein
MWIRNINKGQLQSHQRSEPEFILNPDSDEHRPGRFAVQALYQISSLRIERRSGRNLNQESLAGFDEREFPA